MRHLVGMLLAGVIYVVGTVSHWLIHAAAWLTDQEEVMKDCHVCVSDKRER